MNRILFTTHALPWAHPFPLFSDSEEVDLGVQFKTVREGGRLKFLSTLYERFDIMQVPAIAQGEFSPELILVHADATLGCMPRNLASLPAVRVLLVGDTHHLTAPIQKMAAYALEERFEHVVVWNRQHAHYFIEAGVKHVHWLPGLFFTVPKFSPAPKRENKAVFFGQIGRYHPRRRAVTVALSKFGVPFEARTMARTLGLKWTSSATIGFNCSLNSEFNLRILETLAAGSLLITDRLSPEAGMQEIFDEGADYLAYDSAEEAAEKIKWAVENPEEAAAMAARAQDKYEQFFSLEARKSQLLDILTFGDKHGPFSLSRETRCTGRIMSSLDARELSERIVGYEAIQELHRNDGVLKILFMPSTPPRVLSDIADLPRTQLCVPAGEQGEALLARLPESVRQRFQCVSEVLSQDWSVVIGRADSLRTDSVLLTLLEERAMQYAWLFAAPDDSAFNIPGYERAPGKISFHARASLRRPVIVKSEPVKSQRVKNSRALVTLAVGNRFEALFEEQCRENWQAYADRHGYDLIVLKRPLDTSPRALARNAAWQKCLICEQPETARYERLVWIDADIMINPSAPDISAGVPIEKIGAVDDDAAPTPEHKAIIRDRMSKRWSNILSPFSPNYDPQQYHLDWGLERFPQHHGIVQTGVMVLSPEFHGAFLRKVYDSYEDKGAPQWNYEMRPLSWEILKQDLVHWIDPRFNTITCESIALHYPFFFEQLHVLASQEENTNCFQGVADAFRVSYHNSYFLHFAGMKQLLKILRDDEGKIPGVDPLAEKAHSMST